jgi:hypothetical protein
MQECNLPRNSWLQTHQDDEPPGGARNGRYTTRHLYAREETRERPKLDGWRAALTPGPVRTLDARLFRKSGFPRARA